VRRCRAFTAGLSEVKLSKLYSRDEMNESYFAKTRFRIRTKLAAETIETSR